MVSSLLDQLSALVYVHVEAVAVQQDCSGSGQLAPPSWPRSRHIPQPAELLQDKLLLQPCVVLLNGGS